MSWPHFDACCSYGRFLSRDLQCDLQYFLFSVDDQQEAEALEELD